MSPSSVGQVASCGQGLGQVIASATFLGMQAARTAALRQVGAAVVSIDEIGTGTAVGVAQATNLALVGIPAKLNAYSEGNPNGVPG